VAGQGPHGGEALDASANLAEVNVQLLPSAERGVPSADIARRWREAMGEVPGAKELVFTGSLFTAGEDVNVELAHPDFDVLLRAVARLEQELGEFPGVEQVANTFLAGKQELEVELSPAGRAAGLLPEDLARQVRSAFYGAEAQRVQRGRDDVRVMVRYPREQRRSLEDLERLRVRLPDGTELPFRTVAVVRTGRGFASIQRTDRRRVVSVTAELDDTVANANELNDELRARVLPALVRDFPGLSFGFEGQQREQRESIESLGKNFAYALLAIFALLAVPFRSYTQPLIVMAAIPFGLVGAVGGHMLMGIDLSLLSMFGLVALSGVVVNDSLIMIDLVNRERARGADLYVVVRECGMRRFRPILLTTLTTFLGLTPMLLETSFQARFLVPMAVSLGFGVVFATAITLVLVPALYMVLEDVHGLFTGSPRGQD
jgi:multidrug efflux pump subunit AcrB